VVARLAAFASALDPLLGPAPGRSALEAIILRAISFHRDDRFQTGRDLQTVLDRVQFDMARQTGEPFGSGALARFVASALEPADGRPGSRRSRPCHRSVAVTPQLVSDSVAPLLCNQCSFCR